MLNTQAINKYKELVKSKWLLPILVSPFFQKKVDEEIKVLWHENWPLTRIVYPNMDKLNISVDGEFDDWVDDRDNMPDWFEGKIIRKYKERMLYLPTAFCASNCQYCFRQDVLDEERARKVEINKISQDLSLLENYLDHNPEMEEVILSGWDPMILPEDKLEEICTFLTRKWVSIRIHTKTISYNPQLITAGKIQVLKENNVRIVFHITHPYEICNIVKEKIEEMRIAGVRLYNQFPLLRGINDHHELLIEHLKLLDSLWIRTLSIFLPDPIKYSWAFRINLERVFSIIDQFNWNSPSWINSTRFVLDSNIGKLRREDMREYSKELWYTIFERNWEFMRYPDFPKELDIPWDIEVMLWGKK